MAALKGCVPGFVYGSVRGEVGHLSSVEANGAYMEVGLTMDSFGGNYQQ